MANKIVATKAADAPMTLLAPLVVTTVDEDGGVTVPLELPPVTTVATGPAGMMVVTPAGTKPAPVGMAPAVT